MARNSKLMRIDPNLNNIYNEMKKQGKVKSFPEFTRLIANKIKGTEKELRFFK